MTTRQPTADRPQWRRLYEVAAAQEGYFTTAQAAVAGYSRQLLRKHLGAGRIVAVLRGIYRIVDFPAGEHDDLVVVWLWSRQQGVFSHVTALLLHELSDALPAQAHVTVPECWRRRRLRVPSGVVLHFADIEPSQQSWVGSVPVTSVVRTLIDCANFHVAPDLVNQAYRQALHRGIIRSNSVPAVTAYLAPYFDMGDAPSTAAAATKPRRARRS
jgi:predicted transcriptional regulator of viral defense system